MVLLTPSARSISAPSDPSRVHAFVKAHYGFAWRLLRRAGLAPADADDAAQKVFLIAASRLETIASGSERAFLFRTAMHVASKAHRAVRRRPDVPGLDGDEAPDELPLADALLDQSRARALLDRILGELPGDLRAAFVLFEIEGLTTTEVAEALGVPLGTVASRLRRARLEVEERVARHQARARFKGALR
jgi:RNA polymerase sigma-70 factor (ECF subfamily)